MTNKNTEKHKESMAEVIKPINNFKRFCKVRGLDYVELEQGIVIVFHFEQDTVNIRQYADEGICVSSWTSLSELVDEIIGRVKV